MRQRFTQCAAILFSALLLTLASIPGALAFNEKKAGEDAEYIATPGLEQSSKEEILVKFKKSTGKDKKKAILASEQLTETASLDEINVKVIKLPKGKQLSDIKGLAKKYEEIESVEENTLAYASFIPNDPVYKTEQYYAYELLKVDKMWDYMNAANVTVAVLDTGVLATHPDMKDRVLSGYDYINNKTGAADDNGHGTRVAGFIAAVGNNALGTAGMNWDVRILPVKVMNASGVGTSASVAKGIIYAADNGASIINLSLGMTSDSVTLRSAVDYALGKGCIIVAAAGNTGAGTLEYPAKYSGVIGVGAYSTTAGRMSYSNYGEGLTALTFGSGTTTTMAGGSGSCSGTSFASPIIAGILSLAKGLYPSLTGEDAFNLIREGCVDLGTPGYDTQFGYGYLEFEKFANAVKTLAGSAETVAPTPTPTPVPTPQPTPTPTPTLTPTPTPAPTPTPSPSGPVYVEVAKRDTLTFTGSLGNNRDPVVGLHTFTVDSVGRLDLALSWNGNNKNDFAVKIIDPSGKTVATTSGSALNNARNLAMELTTTGDYKAEVSRISGKASYTLKVTLPEYYVLEEQKPPLSDLPGQQGAPWVLILSLSSVLIALGTLIYVRIKLRVR